MTKTILRTSRRYKRWIAIWALVGWILLMPAAFALEVDLTIFDAPICETNLSHLLTVQWNISDTPLTADVLLEVIQANGTFQTFNTVGNQGSQSFNLIQPEGGFVEVRLTATITRAGSSSETQSVSRSFQLSPCMNSDCPTNREALAERLLPSISNFALLDRSQFDFMSEFPVPDPIPGSQRNAQGTEVVPTNVGRILIGDVGTGDTGNAFDGTDINGNGQVSLYVVDDLVSGFLSLRDEWVFVEPLQFLLQSQVQNDRLLRSFDPNGTCSVREYLDLMSDPFLFPAGSQFHIVYNTKDTDFSIQLEQTTPANATSKSNDHEVSDLRFETEAVETSNTRYLTQEAPTRSRLSVLPFGDAAFRFRYLNTKETWLDAQLEVLTLVRTFYQKANLELNILKPRAFDDSNPVSIEKLIEQANPLRASLPDQNGDGINDLNAFTLLCHFAQGIPNEPANPPVLGDVSGPFVTHLFTGQNLGPIYIDEGSPSFADSGCCFCDNNCGTDGPNIIGLAEGVAGLWRTESNSCRSPLGELDPAANRSLSQHVPTANDDGFNKNYQATLYQRFLIVTHEIGHTLSLAHSEDATSVMHFSLINEPQGNTIEFKVDQTELNGISNTQLEACLDPNVEPCLQTE